MSQHSARVGLGLSAVAAATFGTSGTFAESLIKAGWSPAGVVVARISLASVFLTIPAIISLRGQWFLLRRSAPMIAAFGLIAIAACQVTYFNAVSRLSVGVALMLEYLGVILVVAWLWLRHGHRPRRLTLIGGAGSIVGLVLVLNLTSSQHLDPVGVIWAWRGRGRPRDLLHPLGQHRRAAATDRAGLGRLGRRRRRAVRRRRTRGGQAAREHDATCSFAGHQTSFIVPIIGLSLIAGAIAYISSIGSARILGAKLASFVGLTEVLFAVLFAWILLGQLPGVMQLFGGLFIVGGVVAVRIDELRHPVLAPEPDEVALPVA